jgi:hypothetical protein
LRPEEHLQIVREREREREQERVRDSVDVSTFDHLAEADPGPTPMLVEELLVGGSLAAIQGQPKTWKTWLELELVRAIVLLPFEDRTSTSTPGSSRSPAS